MPEKRSLRGIVPDGEERPMQNCIGLYQERHLISLRWSSTRSVNSILGLFQYDRMQWAELVEESILERKKQFLVMSPFPTLRG